MIAIAAALLAGCSQTSRIDEATATPSLGERRKAVALMRVGAASVSCVNVAVLLGTREGDGYRRGQVIKVANVRSLADVPVAEVELEAGEHHVIGYACQSDRATTTVMDKADAQTYRTSYARFSVAAGEVVNVGYLHFGASHVGRSAFGRPLQLDVSVSDWPLREIDLFKQKRPALYARMKTRLMQVSDPGGAEAGPGDCARMRVLQAEGKLQAMPAVCATGPTPLPSLSGSRRRSTP